MRTYLRLQKSFFPYRHCVSKRNLCLRYLIVCSVTRASYHRTTAFLMNTSTLILSAATAGVIVFQLLQQLYLLAMGAR